jgi:PhnB protein
MKTRPSIIPWLSVDNATQAVNFYQNALGAEVIESLNDDSGTIAVAQLSFGGALAWLQQDENANPHTFGGSPVRMLLVVEDPQALFTQAVAAGATEVASMHEEHGWLTGRVTDPFGHDWEFSKQING